MLEIHGLIMAALYECCASGLVSTVADSFEIQRAARLIEGDLSAYLTKDPAAGRVSLVLCGSSSFKAVLHYRLAAALLRLADRNAFGAGLEVADSASLMSYRGKILSGADIHPRAQIGPRFVLDHGYGTVIGETTDIGEDCYVLGGVTLGATGIANNHSAKRHPTIGDRVEIGAFSSVLGPVWIGAGSFIGAHCVVTEDVPEGSRVLLKCKNQVVRIAGRASAAVNPLSEAV